MRLGVLLPHEQLWNVTGSKQGAEKKADQSDTIAEEHYRSSKGFVIDKNDVEGHTDDPDAYQGE